MGKNIVIIVLVIFCSGFLVYSLYQQAIAEKALVEAMVQREKAQANAELAQKNADEAIKQRDIAVQALQEAETQRQRAEEALKKCK